MGRIAWQGRTEALAWVALLALLAFTLPLFVCMPLTVDTINYDVCARTVLRGGVLYRDAFDNNLPGVVWIHCAVRGLFGERSEVIRGFDLVVFGAVTGLLLWWVALCGRSRTTLIVTGTLLFAFYSSRWEWCHTQRDTWMLVPALAALHLRRIQVDRLRRPGVGTGPLALGSVAEGLVWGSAVWIKPHVLVPALACWIVGALLVRGASVRVGRRLALDAVGLLSGGLLMGAAGIFWLYHSGAWAAFWDISTNWNREYYTGTSVAYRVPRLIECGEHFLPWSLAIPVVVPLAVLAIRRARLRTPDPGPPQPVVLQALLGALFLGWLGQTLFLQRPFDYVFVPPVLLGLTFLAGLSPPAIVRRRVAAGLILFLIVAAFRHPLFWRADVWGRCWREGSTPEVRGRLAQEGSIDWLAEAHVAAYLRGKVSDGELTCYETTTSSLYCDLGVEPSTRYVFLHNAILYFPSHAGQVRAEVIASRERYFVTDWSTSHLSDAEKKVLPEEGETAEPDRRLGLLRPDFPWSMPIVFRSGHYLVHRVPRREGEIDDR